MSSSSPQAPTASTIRRPSVTKWIIVFILRIVVLAGFSAGAIALGLLAGQLTPRTAPGKPLLLKLLTQDEAAPVVTKPVLNPTIAALSPEDKAAIEQETKGIREQLQVLEGRIQQLETELKLEPQQGDLALRLTNLTELLKADTTTMPPVPEATTPQPQNDNLKITLPTNILFNDQGQLKTDAAAILEAIAIDLQANKNKTITIAGHNFSTNEKIKAEELSFQQAQTIKLYLAKQVPGDYRWIIVGYGASRPLATDNLQANQRIEITTQSTQ